MSATQKETEEGPGRAPPTQRPRQANGRAGTGEGMRSGWRPCQQHSQAVEASDERQSHRHANQQRSRRNESSSGRGGGRTQTPRGPAQEGGAPQQPRPGVTRYRRAQPPRHKHREPGDPEAHPAAGGNIATPTGSEGWAGAGVGAGMGIAALSGPPVEVGRFGPSQFLPEPAGRTPSACSPHAAPAPVLPSRSPDNNHAASNPRTSKSRRTRQQRTVSATEPDTTELDVEPTIGPHAKPNIEPCAETNAEPDAEPSPEPHSYTDGDTEPHKESHTGSCTESYMESDRDPHPELGTDPHGPLGLGHEEMEEEGEGVEGGWEGVEGEWEGVEGEWEGVEGEWEGEWVQQTALQLRQAGLRLFEQAGRWQGRTVGSRLHHYDGGSDGEPDSPEKEPEAPLSPGERDGETVKTGSRRRQRSWSLDRALGEEGDWPESEQDSQRELGPRQPLDELAFKGEVGPRQPLDELAFKGEMGLSKPLDDLAFKGEMGLSKPLDDLAFKGEIGTSKPLDEQAFEGEMGPSKPQDEQAFHGEVGQGKPQGEQAVQEELEPGRHQDEQAFEGKIGPSKPQDEQEFKRKTGPSKPQDEQEFKRKTGPSKPQDEQEFKRKTGPSKPQDEQAFEGEIGSGEPKVEQAFQGELEPGKPQDEQASPQEPQNEYGAGGRSWGTRESLSLAIKDIKEAIQEVKTRTVRSPYTPEEPVEPVWVMRQDLSPTMEGDLQPSLGSVSSLDSDSASPLGAESIDRPQLQEASYSIESPPSQESRKTLATFPTYVDVPGPCDPEDLIDGIIFAANYLGSTQLLSDKTPSKSVRMTQAQEAVSRVRMAKSRKKSPEVQPPGTTEVDLFISTQRIKVLNADSQEAMMDHPLRTISYIADIGDIVVLMARRKKPRPQSQELAGTGDPAQEGRSQYSDPAQERRNQYNNSAQEGRSQYSDTAQEGRSQYNDSAPGERRQYRMICHVFESEDAQLIAQSIGQAFSVAYQEFLRANGIDPEDLSQREYCDLLTTQDMYNDDLIHFSKSENRKNVQIEKQKGEILGVVVVESGWGSILPTVIIASMMHGGPAERSGRLSIGDQVMSINGTSLVGLPLTTCQSIIKGLKSQPRLKLNIVRCPPVTTVLIRRPDLRYQLGFSVQNGIICSLMRGGIAERGGVRVGHRIIEISGQSVVATPHERIVNILSSAVGEIHMKTMPAAMYRLLTGQEQPVYI